MSEKYEPTKPPCWEVHAADSKLANCELCEDWFRFCIFEATKKNIPAPHLGWTKEDLEKWRGEESTEGE